MSRHDAAEHNSQQPEVHVVSPAQRRRLQQCYEHGTKLLQQEEYDYAHSILVECVLKDPGNLDYVDALLQNLQRKYKNNKRGARFKGFAGRGPFKKAVANGEWAEALRLGPELLKTNPWDVQVLRGLAQASAAFGYHDVELRFLKNALEADPRHPETNRHCARALAHVGQYDQAIACWHRVDEACKGDAEAQKMISELQIEKTRQRAGLGAEEGRLLAARRPAAAEEPPAEPPRRREVRLTPRQQLEQQIVNNPADLEACLQLAQLHVDEDRLGEAAYVLRKALAASADVANTEEGLRVQERLEDVDILRKQRQLAAAEKRAAGEPSEEAQRLVRQLRSELDRFESDVYLQRSQRHPQDLELRFQLGLRLKRLDQTREAVQCFELARQSPARHVEASLELGDCWQRLKQYGKALDCYSRAAQACTSGPADLKKLALYRAGALAMSLHNLESAQLHLGQLVEMDPSYRDATARLDKIRQIRDKR